MVRRLEYVPTGGAFHDDSTPSATLFKLVPETENVYILDRDSSSRAKSKFLPEARLFI